MSKYTIEDAKKIAQINNGICLSDTYKSYKDKLYWKCGCGFEWAGRFDHVRNGSWCPKCPLHASVQELEIYQFVKSMYPDTESGATGLLQSKRLELDIYVPSIKKAIEYDGFYWHKNEDVMKRDKRKNKECAEAGIKLLRIKDKVFIRNKEKTFNNILYFLRNI